ncbi:MAG TPA: bifunctional hydroxymethylpyrimidine kinase/phosphomethylpyrimidine kinase [Candidatus Cybelea sp.]
MNTIVLSIGTSHPWNVAGIGRDVIVGERLDARVFTAIAAVSAQDGRGSVVVQPVSRDVLAAQLTALPWDAAGAVRVGALPTRDAVDAVAAVLRAHAWLPAVVDPVFAASGGGELGDAAARDAIRDDLAHLGNVVLTPNLAEAATLLGSGGIDRASIGDAAASLQARGALAVLLKGGHLDGAPVDALATSSGVEFFTEPRIAGRMHGTGCTLAIALACELACGAALRDAVRAARAFVRDQIAQH